MSRSASKRRQLVSDSGSVTNMSYVRGHNSSYYDRQRFQDSQDDASTFSVKSDLNALEKRLSQLEVSQVQGEPDLSLGRGIMETDCHNIEAPPGRLGLILDSKSGGEYGTKMIANIYI